MKKRNFDTNLLNKPHAIIQSVTRLANSNLVNNCEYAVVIRKQDMYGNLINVSFTKQVAVVDIPHQDMKEIDLSQYKPVLVTEDGTVYEPKNCNFRNLLTLNTY